MKVKVNWSSNPEDADSIPNRKALLLHFLQLKSRFGSYNVYLNDTRISYTQLWLIYYILFNAGYYTNLSMVRY